MAAQLDGKILIGGEIAYHGNKPVNNLIRIAPDGTLDAAFAPDLPHGYVVQYIQLMNSGDISRSRSVRLNSDGSVDGLLPGNDNLHSSRCPVARVTSS